MRPSSSSLSPVSGNLPPSNISAVFRDAGVARQEKLAIEIPGVNTIQPEYLIPAYIVDSGVTGPTILVQAGVHGAEASGISGARWLIQHHRRLIKGRLIVMPILNTSAAEEGIEFVMAQDNKNLNRQFPGRAQGTSSQILAHWLTTEVYPHCDRVIDMHSGDLRERLTPFIAYVRDHPASRDLARMARLPLSHKLVELERNGYAIQGAVEAGASAIVVEIGGEGASRPDWSAHHAELVHSILAADGMIEHNSDEIRATSDTVSFSGIIARKEGIWMPLNTNEEQVVKDQVVGRIEDVFGSVLEEASAEKEGSILYHRTAFYVKPGDVLYVIGCPV